MTDSAAPEPSPCARAAAVRDKRPLSPRRRRAGSVRGHKLSSLPQATPAGPGRATTAPAETQLIGHNGRAAAAAAAAARRRRSQCHAKSN